MNGGCFRHEFSGAYPLTIVRDWGRCDATSRTRAHSDSQDASGLVIKPSSNFPESQPGINESRLFNMFFQWDAIRILDGAERSPEVTALRPTSEDQLQVH